LRIEGEFHMPQPDVLLYERLLDAGVLAQCIPGCESLERVDAVRYRAGVAVALAGISARFKLIVELTHQEPPRRILCVTRGEEGGRASTLSADSEITLEAVDGQTTRVQYVSEVQLTGRLGRFALGVMQKKAQAMGREFADNLRQRLAQQDG
jgi:carbon monoxide dehydrogenase subunit G